MKSSSSVAESFRYFTVQDCIGRIYLAGGVGNDGEDDDEDGAAADNEGLDGPFPVLKTIVESVMLKTEMFLGEAGWSA